VSQFEKRTTELKKLVNQQLAGMLTKKLPITLYDPMRYVLQGGGKRLRPLLVLLACEAVGGKVESCLPAALAVEFLHNFTLIHDDVMDQDDIRRGRLTVHKKWDVSIAILSGDGLVALSYRVLLSKSHPRIAEIGTLFSNTLLEICEGQALDKEFETRKEVAVNEYFVMIQKKTAALMALCAQIGGILGNGTDAEIEALRSFGFHLGVAFQLQDDLLDIVADEKLLGKTWGSDIMRRKKTFLLIHALQQGDATTKSQLQAILQKEVIAQSQVEEVKKLFQVAGTIEATQQHINRHFDLARQYLHRLPSSQGRQFLDRFLDSLVKRQY